MENKFVVEFVDNEKNTKKKIIKAKDIHEADDKANDEMIASKLAAGTCLETGVKVPYIVNYKIYNF